MRPRLKRSQFPVDRRLRDQVTPHLLTPSVHVTETAADDALNKGGAVTIRASSPGTYSAKLSNGQTVRGTIGAVPPPIDLTHVRWHLSAEDWQPENPYKTTFGGEGSQTRKDRLELDLEGLKPWPEIPSLQNASGLGTYTTAFDLPSSWTPSNGALLNLGEVFDTFTVSVNGRAVAIDQLSAEGDIGPYLKPGRNTIAVRVATTLNNRLAKMDDDVAARGLVQPYGLVGPVRLTPYGTATVWNPR